MVLGTVREREIFAARENMRCVALTLSDGKKWYLTGACGCGDDQWMRRVYYNMGALSEELPFFIALA